MKIVREQEWLVQIHLAGRRIRRFAIVPARRRAVGTASRDCLWIRAHYELTHLPDYGQQKAIELLLVCRRCGSYRIAARIGVPSTACPWVERLCHSWRK